MIFLKERNTNIRETIIDAFIASLSLYVVTTLMGYVVQHDDLYNLALAQDYSYLNKMLPSGRWLSYVTAPAFTSFNTATVVLLNALAWGAGCSLVASVIVVRRWKKLSLTLLLAWCPAYLSILQWPYMNVMISVWFLLYALSLYASGKYITFPLAVMGATLIYQPLAIAILPIEMFAHKEKNIRQISRQNTIIIGSFAIGIVTAILVQYTVNYFFFGKFGLVLESWRNVIPLTGFASEIARLEAAISQLSSIIWKEYILFFPSMLILITAFYINKSVEILRGFYALGAVVGILLLIGLATGVEIEHRITIGLWFAISIICTISVGVCSKRWRRLLMLALILPSVHIAMEGQRYLAQSRLFQKRERIAAALAVEARNAPPTATVVFAGNVSNGFAADPTLSRQFADALQFAGALNRNGMDRPYLECWHTTDPTCRAAGVNLRFAESLSTFPKPGSDSLRGEFFYIRLGRIGGLRRN